MPENLNYPYFRKQKFEQYQDNEAQLIYQRGFGFTKNGKLGTAGLGPCIGLVAYNPNTRSLIVAHFDTMTKVDSSISNIVDGLKLYGNNDLSEIQITLTGGDPSSSELRNKINYSIQDQGITNITDLNPNSDPNISPRVFVVDSKDGIIKPNIFPAKPENPEVRTARMLRTQAPIYTELFPETEW